MKVQIKDEIVKRLKKRVEESDEFKDVESYINYILKQVVERLKEESGKKEKKVYSKEEEKKVKERLKSLGYLD